MYLKQLSDVNRFRVYRALEQGLGWEDIAVMIKVPHDEWPSVRQMVWRILERQARKDAKREKRKAERRKAS